MGELRESILKQELQREIDLARNLDAEEKHEQANQHYMKAAAISRTLGFESSKERAQKMFENATQYEAIGSRKIQPDGKATGDMAEIEGTIDSLIVSEKPDTKWDDIGNLESAKTELKEAVILPFIKDKPSFVKSTKTILLYGPPGTGKTLLAKASSNTLNATFFEAKASSLLSKYFGESGKLVNALFTKAKRVQPSVIFMDEIDSVVLNRDMQVNEATRRVIGQLLSEIDGFNTKKDESVVFIGATNKPWDLDDAMVSRFQRKVYVPLPDTHARKIIFQIHMRGADVDGITFGDLAEMSERFSGRDIANICQEAISNMVREENKGIQDLTSAQVSNYKIKYRPLGKSDFEESFSKIKPASTNQDMKRFDDWREKFGG